MSCLFDNNAQKPLGLTVPMQTAACTLPAGRPSAASGNVSAAAFVFAFTFFAYFFTGS